MPLERVVYTYAWGWVGVNLQRQYGVYNIYSAKIYMTPNFS